jgi:Protein of unknown function (DUF1264)
MYSSLVVVVSCASATCSNSSDPSAGPPQLMMSLTEDGMLDPELVKKRDADYGISTEASSPRPPMHAAAQQLHAAVWCITRRQGGDATPA